MIDNEPPRPGDYRITHNPLHHMGPSWPWAYSVEQLKPAGKWLFWSWPEKWELVRNNLQHDDAKHLIKILQNGGSGAKPISYHKGS